MARQGTCHRWQITCLRQELRNLRKACRIPLRQNCGKTVAGNVPLKGKVFCLLPAMENRRLLVLYGSQTGCAEEVAERVAREAAARHLVPILLSMDEYDVRMLPSETLAVFVCSTTGQGDAPDSMRSFWSFLLRKSLPADSLTACKFATFGLGDSGYAKFNATAKRLDRRIEMLGGQRIVSLGLGDDQDKNGYDEALDPWLNALWDAVLQVYPLPPGASIDTNRTLPSPRYHITVLSSDSNSAHGRQQIDDQVHAKKSGSWSSTTPFMARVVKSVVLTGTDAEKEVRHFELDVQSSGMSFQAGDSVAVQVREVCARHARTHA
jgi:sulfite reductase alpha subunit-like flavoprotein